MVTQIENQTTDTMRSAALLSQAKGRPIVTVFGSARLTPDAPAYQDAEMSGRLLAQSGYAVLTGGGPGVMEAANKGAFLAHGISLAACIQLPFEEALNPYVTTSTVYEEFGPRKNCLMRETDAFLVYPGGYGTCDELFEILTLQATGKIRITPIVLVGRAYWEKLADWLRCEVMGNTRCISQKELDLFRLADDAHDAVRLLRAELSSRPAGRHASHTVRMLKHVEYRSHVTAHQIA